MGKISFLKIWDIEQRFITSSWYFLTDASINKLHGKAQGHRGNETELLC